MGETGHYYFWLTFLINWILACAANLFAGFNANIAVKYEIAE